MLSAYDRFQFLDLFPIDKSAEPAQSMTKASLPAYHGPRIKQEWPAFFFSLAFLLGLEAYFRPQAIDGVYFQRWTSEDMMQTLSVADLRREPLQSLLNLHIQPPLLDLIRTGLAQLWPTASERVLLTHVDQGLYLIWALFYAGMGFLLYHWFSQLTSRGLAALATGLFMIHPATILYATFLENTFLFSFGVLWSTYELWKLSKRPMETAILPLSAAFLFTYFARSIYQWPVFFLYLLSLFLLRVPRRKIAVFALVAGAAVGFCTLRQYLVFGIPYTSSLAGGNCFHGLGDFSNYAGYGVSDIPILPPPNASAALNRETKITGVSNMNNYKHLQYHLVMLSRCTQRLFSQPWTETATAYLQNFIIYIHPSAQFTTPHVIADQIPWRGLYNAVFSRFALLGLIIFAFAIWFALNGRRKLWAALGLFLPVGYVLVLTVLFERGENMRYKFFIEPVFYVFLVAQLIALSGAYRTRFAPNEASSASGGSLP